MSTFIDKPGQSSTNSIEQTPDSSSEEQSFFDYTIKSISYITGKITEKLDLSKPVDGYIIHQRLVTPSQASGRSSEAFIKSITKDKHNKIWEYFVFVKEISDSIPTATIEQTDIYSQLKKAESDFKLNPKNYKGSIQEKFDKTFKGSEKDNFINEMDIYLLSAIRFYGVSSSSPGNGIRKCKVLFHDPKKLQFGKMISIDDPLEHEYESSLESRIREAVRELNIQSSSVSKDKTNTKTKNLKNQIKTKKDEQEST